MELATSGNCGRWVERREPLPACIVVPKGGRLYFPVAVGLSNDDRVMEAARACFAGLKQVVDVWFPLSEEEYEVVSCCLPPSLLEKVRRKGSRMAWNGHIFEATRPIM